MTAHEITITDLPDKVAGGIASAGCSCGEWSDTQSYVRETGRPVAARLLRQRGRIHQQEKGNA